MKMQYQKPNLYALTASNHAEGNCGNGSSATHNSTCGTGGNINNTSCNTGSIAAECQNGAGATAVDYCHAGTGTGTACGVGSVA